LKFLLLFLSKYDNIEREGGREGEREGGGGERIYLKNGFIQFSFIVNL
jgi:hypothetical protein